MARGPESRRPERPEWEPEPLPLTIESPCDPRPAGHQERDGTSEDRTGAHVIVIDIA